MKGARSPQRSLDKWAGISDPSSTGRKSDSKRRVLAFPLNPLAVEPGIVPVQTFSKKAALVLASSSQPLDRGEIRPKVHPNVYAGDGANPIK
jgi:hypothetical protein